MSEPIARPRASLAYFKGLTINLLLCQNSGGISGCDGGSLIYYQMIKLPGSQDDAGATIVMSVTEKSIFSTIQILFLTLKFLTI